MRTKHLCGILGLGVVVLMTLSLFGVAGVGAQAGGPPVLPCAFYGTVTIEGAPAPVGTEITATIDDKPVGNITVTEAGGYGGSGGFDPKLVVTGTAEDENKPVSFYVDGAQAEETATWNSGGVKNQDLTVPEAGPGPSPTISPGPTASPSPTATPDGAGIGTLPMAVVIGIVVVVALMLVGVRKRK